MSIPVLQKPPHSVNPQRALIFLKERIFLIRFHWEIYPILAIAAFLRLFNIDKVVFDDDEAVVFQMARDAFSHGLLPITSNRASVGFLNPPLAVYIFMLPASLSANPLWGQVMVALFNTVAVLLCYLFVRRYYGRFAGALAALLYATSMGVWTYSHNIWPQAFLPFFVLLLLFALFRGTVEHKKGWFAPAILLLGLLLQLHPSTIFLLAPLCAAVVFAFKTIRLRDVLLAALALLVVFFPYLFWGFHSQFSDMLGLLLKSKQYPSVFNLQALQMYLFFVHPTTTNPYLVGSIAKLSDNHVFLPDAQSVLLTTPLRHLTKLLNGEYYLACFCLLGGVVTATLIVLRPQASTNGRSKNFLVYWWSDLLASPERQGLALLLLWQLVPLVFLTRESLELFTHYFIFLLPGQFILIALFVKYCLTFLQQYRPDRKKMIYLSVATLAALLVLGQSIGIGSALADFSLGNFDAHQVFPAFNDLHSLQNALHEADQLAIQRHIHRIYAMESFSVDSALDYLSEDVQTPIELTDTWHCLTLPSPEAGPVVFLALPGSDLATTMLAQYTHATLVAEPPRLGGSPYQIYILTALPEPSPVSQAFTNNWRLISPDAQVIQSTAGQRWLTTRWSTATTNQPAPRTHYNFNLRVQAGQSSSMTGSLSCTQTATWSGDQVLVFEPLQVSDIPPAHITLQASLSTERPQILQEGPLTLTTFNTIFSSPQPLFMANHKQDVTLQVL